MNYRKWNRKRAIVAMFFSVATFAICFVFGNAITMAFGPGTSGIVTIIFTTIIVVCGARITELRGVFTLMVTLFTLFAIPTNMFGPAGPYKLIIGFITGILYDIVWEILGRKKWSLPIAAMISTAASVVLIWQLLIILDHPKANYLTKYIYYFIGVYGLLGFIGALIGGRIYDRYFATSKNVATIKE